MITLLAFACLAGTLLLIKALKLFEHAEQIMAASKKANEIGQDKSLDDLTREKQTQQQAIILLKLFVRVLLESTVAFFGPVFEKMFTEPRDAHSSEGALVPGEEAPRRHVW